MKLLKQDEK